MWKVSVFVTILKIVICLAEETRRPIWNIAHMANSIKEARDFVSRGANALELDVEFDDAMVPIRAYHVGKICDCKRDCQKHDDFVDYLEFLSDITDMDSDNYEKGLILVFLDLKVSGLTADQTAEAGKNLASKLAKHLWNYGAKHINVQVLLCLYGPPALVLAASYHETMLELGMKKQLEVTGWDITGYMAVEELEDVWNKMNFNCRVWQGDGMSNCLSYSCSRLDSVLRARNKNVPFMSKVYYWVAEGNRTISNVLSMGVDGLITNNPEWVSAIVKESTSYRLATNLDSPWKNGYCYNDMVSTEEAKKLVANLAADNNLSLYYLIAKGTILWHSRC